jgi:hypothetical protein
MLAERRVMVRRKSGGSLRGLKSGPNVSDILFMWDYLSSGVAWLFIFLESSILWWQSYPMQYVCAVPDNSQTIQSCQDCWWAHLINSDRPTWIHRLINSSGGPIQSHWILTAVGPANPIGTNNTGGPSQSHWILIAVGPSNPNGY